MEGRFEDAAALIDETYAVGETAYSWNADVTRRVQRFLFLPVARQLAHGLLAVQQRLLRPGLGLVQPVQFQVQWR